MAKLSDKTIKIIYKNLDEAVDNLVRKFLPKAIAIPIEFLDNIVEKAMLNYLNDKLGDKIPNSFNSVIDKLAVDLDKEDWQAVSTDLATGLANEIKTPLVDGTPEENTLYKYVIGSLMNLLGLKVNLMLGK